MCDCVIRRVERASKSPRARDRTLFRSKHPNARSISYKRDRMRNLAACWYTCPLRVLLLKRSTVMRKARRPQLSRYVLRACCCEKAACVAGVVANRSLNPSWLPPAARNGPKQSAQIPSPYSLHPCSGPRFPNLPPSPPPLSPPLIPILLWPSIATTSTSDVQALEQVSVSTPRDLVRLGAFPDVLVGAVRERLGEERFASMADRVTAGAVERWRREGDRLLEQRPWLELWVHEG